MHFRRGKKNFYCNLLSLFVCLSHGVKIMKFCRFSFLLISKFKNSHFSSLRYFCTQYKNKVLCKKFSNSVLSAQYYSSIVNEYQVNSLLSKSGKLFKENENEYAHSVMENISEYANSVLKPPVFNDTLISETNELHNSCNAIEKFFNITLQNMTVNESLEDSKFANLIEKVLCELPEVSDENLKKILQYLCFWPPAPSTCAPNFKVLWNTLDRECVKRLNQWNVSQKLLIADCWFHLKLSRISQYNPAMILNLLKVIDTLSNHEVIQLMFYINLQRKIPEMFLSNLERKLDRIINSLTVEELGIACIGCFKTQYSISNINLLKSVMKKFMNNIENVNTITAASILKFLRKSMNHSLTDLYILTLHKCIPFIDNFDIPTSVHLALLASESNVYHPLLLNCVSERLIKEFCNVRIKDCAKLLMCFSLHNHTDNRFRDNFFVELMKEDRQNEVNSYPKHVVHSALAYAYIGYYNYDLLNIILKPEFFKKTVLHYPELYASYAEIDYCVEIECPDYNGPRLDISLKNILQNRRGNLPSKSKVQNMQTRLLSEVYDSLIELLGSEKDVLIRHILPHLYSPDIIIRISGNMDKHLADLYQDFSPNLILKPPPTEVWAALVVGSVYSFASKSTQMTGTTAMKLRQLEKLGYHVIFIPYFNVSRKTSQRKAFLSEKLNTVKRKCQTAVL